MKQIIYLDHQEKSVTGGHKYNDEFSAYLEKLSGVKIQSTPSCANKYHGFWKVLAPIAELKHLKRFSNDTLVMFGDTTFKYHFILAILNKWITKTKTSIIIHHFPFIGQKGILWKINKFLMCRYVSVMDNIVVPSPYTMDVARNLFPNSQIFYVPLPFERKINKSTCFEKGNLLYVGTIEERKGLSYLIEAISLLENKESIKLNLVGKIVDQSYYEQLQQQIKELGLVDNVIFRGRVSDEVLSECYQKAEIFTFPSLLEGYGIVLIEAFNHGLPIICFNNTAMPYTVKDGVNGLVARNKDVKDLSDKIHLLVGNKCLREKLQEGIESTVMNLYQRKDFEIGIENFYHNVCIR